MLAIFIPASGAMADRLGARRVFSVAIGVFVIGSIVCWLTTSLSAMVSARLLRAPVAR